MRKRNFGSWQHLQWSLTDQIFDIKLFFDTEAKTFEDSDAKIFEPSEDATIYVIRFYLPMFLAHF